MSSLNSSVRPLVVVAVLLAVAACANRPTVEAVSKFSVALEGASASVQQGLGEIQRLETAVNDAAEAENFIREANPKIQFDRNENITDAVIAPRLAFFKALSDYASSLAAAVSDEQVEKVRAQFTATGQAFTDLGTKVAAGSGARFPSDLAGQVSKAAANLAAFMVDAKLNREIPIIVSGTHDDLAAGVAAFKADLGDPAAGGFRAIMHDTIGILIGQKKKLLLVLKKEPTTSKAALYNAVLEAQAQVRELRKSERLLSAIPPALDNLLIAHAALKTPNDQTTLGKIEIFFQRAKELQAIANDLNS
jgi:hypothetical protein